MVVPDQLTHGVSSRIHNGILKYLGVLQYRFFTAGRRVVTRLRFIQMDHGEGVRLRGRRGAIARRAASRPTQLRRQGVNRVKSELLSVCRCIIIYLYVFFFLVHAHSARPYACVELTPTLIQGQ